MPVNTGNVLNLIRMEPGYIGAFFRNDEQGERIITGQQKRRDGTNERPQDLGTLGLWKAEVEEGNFIVLSSTPSFDPNVGTDNPGVAEHYKVLPNKYKGENGTYVEGRGRIYFRMGVTGKMPERLLGMLK